MRLIDADALREKVLYHADTMNHAENHEQAKAFNYCLCMIDDMPTVDVPQWIPCSERLPEKDTDVLGYIRCESFDYMNVLWRDDYSGDWADGDNFHHEVLAWMPLPEPWKGEAK